MLKVSIPVGVKLFVEQYPKTQEEKEYMASVSYASVVGILVYVMVCIRNYISQAMRVLSMHMSTLGEEHWTINKRVFRYLHGTTDQAICY